MSVFGKYSHYYDLLYRDKDYASEVKYINRLIQSHAPQAQSILELGCGTGNHAVLLAKEGYQVHGVDLSQEMLAKASDRLTEIEPDLASQLQFTHGDICKVRLKQTFDIVLSLFHVISYQTKNEDLLAVFVSAKTHLKPGGIFIFDIWYGPAVLSDPPSVRVKRFFDEKISVTRIAEPVLYPNENCVDVNYQILIKEQQSGLVEEVKEMHRMRYLFKPEVHFLGQISGLSVIQSEEWMTGKSLDSHSWSGLFILS